MPTMYSSGSDTCGPTRSSRASGRSRQTRSIASSSVCTPFSGERRPTKSTVVGRRVAATGVGRGHEPLRLEPVVQRHAETVHLRMSLADQVGDVAARTGHQVGAAQSAPHAGRRELRQPLALHLERQARARRRLPEHRQEIREIQHVHPVEPAAAQLPGHGARKAAVVQARPDDALLRHVVRVLRQQVQQRRVRPVVDEPVVDAVVGPVLRRVVAPVDEDRHLVPADQPTGRVMHDQPDRILARRQGRVDGLRHEGDAHARSFRATVVAAIRTTRCRHLGGLPDPRSTPVFKMGSTTSGPY